MGQKNKFWPKNEILVKKRNVRQKAKLWSKINLGQKGKFLSKKKFCSKREFFYQKKNVSKFYQKKTFLFKNGNLYLQCAQWYGTCPGHCAFAYPVPYDQGGIIWDCWPLLVKGNAAPGEEEVLNALGLPEGTWEGRWCWCAFGGVERVEDFAKLTALEAQTG